MDGPSPANADTFVPKTVWFYVRAIDGVKARIIYRNESSGDEDESNLGEMADALAFHDADVVE